MLRTSLYRRVILISLGVSLLVAAGLCLFGASYFDKLLEASIDDKFDELSNRAAFMERILEQPEQEMFKRGARALARLNADYGDGEALGGMDLAALQAIARGLDVDGLYLIDGENRIIASSLPADIGLDLSVFTKGFTKRLEGLRGTGMVGNQSIAVSTKTGRICTYQYFSASGSKLILEVSINLEEAFRRCYPNLGYDEFIALTFGSYAREAADSPIVSVDLLQYNRQAAWSLIRPGTRREIDREIAAQAFKQGEVAVRKGGREFRYLTTNRDEFRSNGFANQKLCEIEVDRSPLTRFMLMTAALALISCAAAGLLSLFLARRFFDNFFLVRVEALQEAMNKVAEGGRNLEFETSGEDELAQIGKGVEAMLRDVRATEERLRDAKAAEAMGIMAGGLAHDINNLLAGTVGTASLLKARLEEDGTVPADELKSSLELIENTGRKGEILVRDLLALARLDRPRKATVNLAAIVAETAKLLRASTPPSVKIETKLPADEPLALGSAEDIERILLNLSKNGIQAMTDMVPPEWKRGGKLSIDVEAAETRAGENGRLETKFWAVKVSDEGVGMKPEVLSHLFTPFFSTKSRRGGSGLGLAASKAIAEAQGGRLEASSVEGQGSTFTLILPAASPKLGQTLARHAPEA